jgi:ubiquinone biosynthesis protein COQ9
MTPTPADWADKTEQALLDAALRLAPAQGWTWPSAFAAGRTIGLSEGEVELLVPHGPADLAALLSRRHDAQTLADLPDPKVLKIRQRIRAGCEARLDAAFTDEAAVRRWLGFLALPPNIVLAARLAWESADALWRWAGDTATDENHYSKRALLAGILTGALAIRLAEGREPALAFVDRRIENVMAFEKWKATTPLKPSDLAARAAETLGRLRYRG